MGAWLAPIVPSGSEIILDALDVTSRDMGCVESRIGPLKDGVSVSVWCTVCAKLTLSSNIILDTSDGTPR
jgi:hypothetical protein